MVFCLEISFSFQPWIHSLKSETQTATEDPFKENKQLRLHVYLKT